MSRPFLALVAAVSAVIAFALLRGNRPVRRLRISLVAGSILAVVGFGAGLRLLPVSDAPRASIGPVGFVPPQRARPGRGFAVGVAVKVSSCINPVQVSVVVAGTREYWLDHPWRRSDSIWSPFWVVLPGTGLHDLRVGLADAASDLTSPEHANFWTHDPGKIQIERTLAERGSTVVSGRIEYWKQSLQPVLVSFRANWLSHRGLSTCYLQLPELTGAVTATAAWKAFSQHQEKQYETPGNRAVVQSESGPGPPYVPSLDITHGTLTVQVAGGEVIPDASLPPPNALVDEGAAWTCRSTAESTGEFPPSRGTRLPDVILGTRGAAYSENLIERVASGNCRGVAAIAKDSAAYTRDLVLLGVGAVTSLGITLLIQGFLDWLGGTDRDAAPSTRRSSHRRHAAPNKSSSCRPPRS